jgi:pimeloyl-ACP methyl ester carboxylesterase
MARLFRRAALILLLPLGVVGLLLTGCQSKLIYFPRPYDSGTVTAWRAESGTRVIDYRTTDGAQRAYLLSRSARPERLWFVCGGNGTLALEWSDWLREHGPEQDAWLLYDLPGYGGCEGSPRPASIRRSIEAVVPAAMESLGWTPETDRGRLRFFGHSLGSAVALMAAEEHGMSRGVLMTPFTSSMEMTRAVFGVDLGFIVWHRFDNRERLKRLAGRAGAAVHLFHGDRDEVIPVSMSRELAAEFPAVLRYTEVPGGRHNSLQEAVPEKIRAALAEARR